MRFWRRHCVRSAPALTVLLSRFVLRSRLLFVSRQTERLAMRCVPVPQGRDRHSHVLGALARLSTLAGSLRVCAFLYGDLDGVIGDAGNGGTGLAARPLCVFAQPHWYCYAFRGESVGAARPKPAPKSLRLSGLSSRCGGVGLVRIRAVARVHGKTRPALIYGRAGRAVYRWLQHAPTSRLEPPPSGAESGCVREAVWPRALPAYRHCLLCAV